jgi:hypothetical protein
MKPNWRIRRVSNLVVFVLLVTAPLGCGPKGPELGQVCGTVTLDGNPLEKAVVMFQPTQGRPSFAVTDEEGHYEIKFTIDDQGAQVGTHKVVIRSEIPSEMEDQAAARAELLPKRYHDESQLTAEVSPGANTIDFDLTSS